MSWFDKQEEFDPQRMSLAELEILKEKRWEEAQSMRLVDKLELILNELGTTDTTYFSTTQQMLLQMNSIYSSSVYSTANATTGRAFNKLPVTWELNDGSLKVERSRVGTITVDITGGKRVFNTDTKSFAKGDWLDQIDGAHTLAEIKKQDREGDEKRAEVEALRKKLIEELFI